MVKNAEAAGFNPLTALRNGGAAGFSSTTTPALSGGEIFGQAAGAVGNFLQNFDPFADDRREAEFGLVQAQIANLNADTAHKQNMSFKVPGFTAGAVKRTLGTEGVKATPISSSPTPLVGADPIPVTNPYPEGAKVDPTVPDASGWEDRLGDDVGGLAGGIYTGYKDLIKNFPALGVRLPQDELVRRTWRKGEELVDKAKKHDWSKTPDYDQTPLYLPPSLGMGGW